ENFAGARDARQHLLGKQRKLNEFIGVGSLRRATEAGHALRHVGLETDPAPLAVIGDVYAALALLRQSASDPTLDQLLEPALVHRPDRLVLDQYVAEFVATRQASDV